MAKVTPEYNLAVLHPEIAKQWHPTRNGDKVPEKMAPRSNNRAWWICSKNPDHNWDAVIAQRTRKIGTGCPYCGGTGKKRPSQDNNFAAKYPELTRYWHPTKNSKLPTEFLPHSSKKVWWKCPVAIDHEWEQSPVVIAYNYDKRSGEKYGCPCCSGHKPSITNRLDILFPDVAAQWHPTKNGDLKPADLTGLSDNIVWWKCDQGPDHEWEAAPHSRNSQGGRGCPYCAGQAVSVTNCLATKCPEVAEYWHPTKNGTHTPENTLPGSNRKAWWICRECGEGYKSTIQYTSSSNRATCNLCSFKSRADSRATPKLGESLAELYPLVAKHWHPTKNGDKEPKQIFANSSRKYWWKCPVADDHEWPAATSSVVRSNKESGTFGCPACAGKIATVTNSVASLFPEIAALWHPTKNGDETPADYTFSSGKKVWCVCPDCGNDWYATVGNLTSGDSQRCRDCGIKVRAAKRAIPEPGNTLAEKRPDLAKQWHPTRNGDLTPEDVAPRSSQRVWWKCPVADDHEWSGAIATRVGCPFCSNFMTSVSNILDLTYPDIAKEWHPTKNGELTPADLRWNSTHRVWWKCIAGHEWEIYVVNRTRAGTDCPSCTISRVSKRELSLGHELSHFFDVDFGPVNPVKIGSKKWDVDFVIKELKLIIEYDGAYFHRDKFDLDRRKTESLQSGGWTVFRIREISGRQELEPVTPDDIGIPYHKGSKVLANEVLQQIEKVCDISIPGLSEYLKLDRPVNVRAAREHIATLLRDALQTTLTENS